IYAATRWASFRLVSTPARTTPPCASMPVRNSRCREGPFMSKPFDATLKDLGEDCPEAFVGEFDGPLRLPVKTLNVDLSTVTTAADLVFALGDPPQEIIHID